MYFVEKTKGLSLSKQFDYVLFAIVLLLSCIGLFVLSSATRVMPKGINGDRIMLMQTIGLLIGAIAAIIICTIDYNDFKTLGVLFYVFSMALLVLVLFMGTGDELGSRSWFRFGPISFQPSELAKIAFIIIASLFLERIKEGSSVSKNVLKLILYSAIPIALVLAQRDFGTAMVFIFIFFVMLFIYGMPYRYILALGGTFLASLPFIWFFVLNEKRKERIRVFFDPERDPLGSGMNVIRSKLAIGSGQLYGKGIYSGIQTQNMGVPVKESDFIFSVVGEELGFIGAAFIVVLFFFLLLRCLYIARNSRDPFGSFLVTGVTAMLAFHAIENVGMSIGLLPVTGIPLPFISAGATSMVTNYIAVGIILSVSIRRKKAIFNSSE